jgi:hypothetical protein
MPHLSAGERRPNRGHMPKSAMAHRATDEVEAALCFAFLIDAAAIRIAPKSIDCISDWNSNQHSSGDQESRFRLSEGHRRQKGTGLCAI